MQRAASSAATCWLGDGEGVLQDSQMGPLLLLLTSNVFQSSGRGVLTHL